MLLPQNLGKISLANCQNIKATYSVFINDSNFEVELARWKWKHCNGNELILEDCITITRNMYPNMHSIFLVLLTMPVTSASAERSLITETTQNISSLHNRGDAALNAFDGSGHQRIATAFD